MKTTLIRLVGIVLLLLVLGCGKGPLPTGPVPPSFETVPTSTVRYVTGGGCSNTERAFRGLARLAGYPDPTPGFRKDSLPAGTLSRYLREDPEKSWNDRWMEGIRSRRFQNGYRYQPYGHAFWFQVCSFAAPADSTELRRLRQVADSVRLYRPEAYVVWSGLGVDGAGKCTWANFPRSEWLADSAVAWGYGIRGPSVTLVAGDFERDNCHPGTTGQNKWGRALQVFFRGLP